MIKSLRLYNFQSHRDSFLEFDPGVNVILGNSDSGKTSILRMIKWIQRNKPAGDFVRSWWGGETKGIMETEEGHAITRSKDKENLYKLGKTEFRAFNKDVPEEIQKVLNMNDINLQQQLDSPFLISATPGEVASHFNQIAHLEEIDKSTTAINGWILGIDRQIKADNITIAENQEKTKAYDYLEKLEIQLEVLENEEQRMLVEIKSKNTLVSTIESMEKVEEDVLKASRLLVFEDAVDEILLMIDKRDEKKKDSGKLSDQIDTIERLEKRIAKQNRLIETEEAVDELLAAHERRDKLTKDQKALSTHIASMLDTNVNIENEQVILTKREKRFEQEMPDECPLCNTDLS